MSSEIEKTTEALGQMQVQVRNCEVCSKSCSAQCSRCLKVSYCSKECQHAHRVEHKAECFPLKLAKNPDNPEYPGVVTRDNYWVTTRPIKQGETILTEQPIIDGPSSAFYLDSNDAANRNDDVKFLPLCLSCCKILSMHRKAVVNRCSKCNWYMCGPICEEDSRHKMECELLSKAGVTPTVGRRIEYNFICYLRTIFYKTTQPEKWAELMSYKGAYNIAVDRCGESEIKSELKFALKFLQALELEVDRDMVLQVSSIWKAYMVEDIYRVKAFSIGEIFSKALYITNSCKPNCVSTRDKKTYAHKLLATVDIAAGEVLGRMNVGGAWRTATKQRREILTTTGPKFYCRCERCKDPTECGSYFSALKCPKECRTDDQLANTEDRNLGYILPLNPLDDYTDWKCNNPTCQSTFGSGRVEKLLKPISTKVDVWLSKATKQGFDMVFRTVTQEDMALMDKMEQDIEKYKKVLHPNHYLLFELTLKMGLGSTALLIPMPNRVYEMDFVTSMARKQQSRALYCLEITDRIQPGYSPVRGKCLWILALAKWVDIMGLPNRNAADGIGTFQDFQIKVEEAHRVTREAEAALKSENSVQVQPLLDILIMCRDSIIQVNPAAAAGQ